MATTYLDARNLLAPYVDNGVAVSDTTRIDQRIDEAQRRLIDHYNFLSRREESARPPLTWQLGGTTGVPSSGFLILDNLDATKSMILAIWREENNQLELSQGLESKAYSYIERNITNEVERERRTAYEALTVYSSNTFGGLAGRVGLETLVQYRMPLTRIKSFINRAYQQAIDHHNFVSRRENLERGTITYNTLTGDFEQFDPLLPDEVVRLLALSNIVTDNGADGAGLKSQAFELIERNVMSVVERARRTAGGTEGRLHNELAGGLQIRTERLTTYLAQAAAEASAHYDFLARREDYSTGIKPSPFPYEVLRPLVESYIATVNGAVDVFNAKKQEAFQIIERDLMQNVEAARRALTTPEGQLHNELPNGVTIPTGRLTIYLGQASTEIGAHQSFLQRREDYSGPAPTPTYEQRKLLVESYLATLAGQPEVATALKQQALALIERDVMAAIEAARRSTREALLASANDSFGYHWGRIGLELPEAYRLSDSAVQRMVNAAEEQLMFAGKWVGTVAEYTLSVSATGEFFLPREVETVLYMSFNGDPKPVHDRLNEWMRGGTGYRETDDAWRQGAVDRGESVDPADGFLKRKYWITLPGAGDIPVVRILAKRRFVPHTADADKMYLRNYQAIFEATKGILLGGDQITPHIEKAKEMLAGQIAQQSFVGNRGAAHTRRVLQFR
jgi:hypothetical protein